MRTEDVITTIFLLLLIFLAIVAVRQTNLILMLCATRVAAFKKHKYFNNLVQQHVLRTIDFISDFESAISEGNHDQVTSLKPLLKDFKVQTLKYLDAGDRLLRVHDRKELTQLIEKINKTSNFPG